MPSSISVFTTASPADQPTTTTNAGASGTGTVAELFVPKLDLSESGQADATTCYVIDGGDSTANPCDS